jgi:hypothetical protein
MSKRFRSIRSLYIQATIMIFVIPLFVLVSLFFSFAIKSPFGNEIFYIIFSKFWLPIAILAFGCTLFYKKEFYHLNVSVLSNWLNVLMYYLIVLVFSHGYGCAINAFTGSGEIIIVEGKVIEKKVQALKYKTYFIKIIDNKTKSEEAFHVSFDIYNRLSVGDVYKEQYYKGGFGIPYRWWE